jgi:hypothetical protein
MSFKTHIINILTCFQYVIKLFLQPIAEFHRKCFIINHYLRIL